MRQIPSNLRKCIAIGSPRHILQCVPRSPTLLMPLTPFHLLWHAGLLLAVNDAAGSRNSLQEAKRTERVLISAEWLRASSSGSANRDENPFHRFASEEPLGRRMLARCVLAINACLVRLLPFARSMALKGACSGGRLFGVIAASIGDSNTPCGESGSRLP